MNDSLPYQLLANVVLSLHVALVVFVVGGLAFIVIGNLRSWHWVNSPWFRLVHLATIVVIAAEAWFSVACPLTTLEMWLRSKAHITTYSGSFIEHWLHRILYYEAPSWVFIFGYTLFALIVAATWWHFPPRFNTRIPEERN